MEYRCGNTRVNVEKVCEIAREAGAAIMEVYNSDLESWDVQIKTKDNSPLTKADLNANEIICSSLQQLYPDIPIISEENKLVDYSIRQSYRHYFVVDPLDGTKEFIKRNGQFTVNIGLCEGNAPVLGVVYVPALDVPKMYFAVKGHGAYVEDMAERYPVRIRCKEFSESDEGLILVASASHNTPETDEFIARYKNSSRKSLGSSLKLLLVAEGEAHIYPRLAPTCEWDTCASHAIVLEAGGEVLQPDGSPVIYNKENPLNPFFVVYGTRRSAAAASSKPKSAKPAPDTFASSYRLLGAAAALALAVAYFMFVSSKA